jgi:eukaryotic sulfide quinone oxidoreductase
MFSAVFSRASTRSILAASVVVSVGSISTVMHSSNTECESPKESNEKDQQRIVIVGGGTAGIGIAAQCRNEGMKNITLVEPKTVHYYQPLWTLVAGGLKKNTQSVKSMKDIVPKGTNWIQNSVQAFHPEQNRITLADGTDVEYDYLVVAAGIQINWDDIPGLVNGLSKEGSGVGSVYDYNHSAKTFREFQALQQDFSKAGSTKKMLFTMTPTAIKCAGAPQKIMWVLEDTLRRAGHRDAVDVQFWTPASAMFGVKYYSDKLEAIRQERGVTSMQRHQLMSLDVDKKVATFQNLDSKTLVEHPYDFIHVTPHMSAPDFIKKSPLADEGGWVAVNKNTMQSTKFDNVFGIGDCTDTPNSKTAAAVTAQAPVVVHNLMRAIEGKPLDGKYDGYASCPLLVGVKRCILAEFKYGGDLAETFNYKTGKFPLNLIGSEGALQERFFFFLKNSFFSLAYWTLWPRGQWYGTNGPIKPNVVDKSGVN